MSQFLPDGFIEDNDDTLFAYLLEVSFFNILEITKVF